MDLGSALETPPRRPRKKDAAQIRRARQERILVIAAHHFASYGYPNSSMDGIGRAAEISGPSLYRYFSGKQALLQELISSALRRWEQVVEREQAAGPRSPVSELAALVESTVDAMVDETDLALVYFREGRHLDAGPARAALQQRGSRLQSHWSSLLMAVRPAIGPQHADFVTGSVARMCAGAVDHLPRLDPVDAKRLLSETALGALLGAAIPSKGRAEVGRRGGPTSGRSIQNRSATAVRERGRR